MPAKKRFKTKYAGVFYIEGTSAQGKPEKIYYIRYRKDGKMVEEKAGRQYQDDMTPARACGVRAQRIDGEQASNQENREAEQAKKAAEAGKYTIEKLWGEYRLNRTAGKGLDTDIGRYENHLREPFGKKEPQELVKLDVDRVRIKLLKKKSPQTVKHVLNLLTWIINYGVKNSLCQGIFSHIQNPTVNNEKTEDLSPEQLKRLLAAIGGDSNIAIGNMMKIALYSGMRRGELFDLKWNDLNFETGFIWIRDPKGSRDQKIPMNDMAREVLTGVRRTKSPYVFPTKTENQGTAGQKVVNIQGQK